MGNKKPIVKKRLTKKEKIAALVKEFDRNISRGVKFLDKRFKNTKQWLELIDETKLDLANSNVCVCGQVFGYYWQFIQDEGWEDEDAAKYGFYVSSPLQKQWGDYSYDILTRLWFIRISELRILEGMGVKTPPPFS